MSLDDTLARMRRAATPPGEPAPPVHLLFGYATGTDARWATYAGYACTGDWSLDTAVYQRTTKAELVTCPGCKAMTACAPNSSGVDRA